MSAIHSKVRVKIRTDDVRGLPTITRVKHNILEKLEVADFGVTIVYVHPKIDFYELRDALLGMGMYFNAHEMSFSFYPHEKLDELYSGVLSR